MIYGENDSVRTRDGLLVMNKEKVYFRPGNFYDNKDNLISVDIIRLYYYDENDNEVVLFTGSSHELLMELEQSQETFMNLISNKKDFYLDACYNKSCSKIKLDYFNDFKNDNLMVSNLNDESVARLSAKSNNKDDLIKGLIKNGFKYDSEIGYYYLKEDGVEYYYFPKKNVIKVLVIDGISVRLKLHIDTNIIDINNYDNKNVSFNYLEMNDEEKSIYSKFYYQYLYKYFKDFLEV